ncbi:unnamed protein product [Polarella glacialis]|uniref:Uncharacterized protein n=1 Tax=Polarella glacialis TaxID=89957 RepID=A0A813GI19_POLGL|nr:unnamed protein product [Polarella glacialis]
MAGAPGDVAKAQFIADVLDEVDCNWHTSRGEGELPQLDRGAVFDKQRCVLDFVAARDELLFSLSGMPTENTGADQVMLHNSLESQYLDCREAGHKYFTLSLDLETHFTGEHLSCSVPMVAEQIYPFFWKMLLILDLGVHSVEEVDAMPAPSVHTIHVQEFSWRFDEGQQVFDELLRRFRSQRQMDPPGELASHLDSIVCWKDFLRHTVSFFQLASPYAVPNSGFSCIQHGQRLFRVEVAHWCELPSGMRGRIRAGYSQLGGYDWLSKGVPMHICVPATCSRAAVRSFLLPYFMYKLIGILGSETGSFLDAAVNTSFFTAPESLRLEPLSSWTELSLHAVILGSDGQPLEELKALPLWRHVSSLEEEGAPEVRHVVRTLRCDVNSSSPDSRAACLAGNSAESAPLPFPLARRRALVDPSLTQDAVALRQLGPAGVKVVFAPASWEESDAIYAEAAAVEASVAPEKLFVLRAGRQGAAAAIKDALQFLGSGFVSSDRQDGIFIHKGSATSASAPSVAAASLACRRSSFGHWAALWAASGAPTGPSSLPGHGLAAGLLSWPAAHGLCQQVGGLQETPTGGFSLWELELVDPRQYFRRCSSAPWAGSRRRPPLSRLRRADKVHLQRLAICLPSKCSGLAALPSLPLWLSRWLALAVAPCVADLALPSSTCLRVEASPASEDSKAAVAAAAVGGRPPSTAGKWPGSLQSALCVPGARRRRGAMQTWPRYTGCSCGAQALPCLDVDACAAAAEHLTQGRAGGRRAVVTIHDLQIPFDEVDDRDFRRYVRPAHHLFYEQEGLRLMRERHGLEHLLLVPEPSLARYPLSARARSMLSSKGVRIVELPWLHPPLTASVLNETAADSQTFGPAEFIRLHLWNLTEYETILYLDHDMLLLADVAPLLLCSAATGLYLTTSGNMSPLNMGLHALRPDARVFEAMVEVLSKSEYVPELGFTATPGRRTWGLVDGFGPERGAAHAGLQGFLYYFFYAGDTVVRSALWRRGVRATYAAQVDRCRWNYSKDHLMYKYLTEEEASQPRDWQELLFRCRLGALGRPRIVHKLDEAMLQLLVQSPRRDS